MATSDRKSSGSAPEATAEKHRRLQAEQDQRDASRKAEKPQAKQDGDKPKAKGAQAGSRDQPDQMPSQHIRKPGLESSLELLPHSHAPDYEGSNKLRDMAAIVTGGDSGIGRSVAILYAREGADVAIVYLDEQEDAEETRRLVEAEGRRCVLIFGDVKDL